MQFLKIVTCIFKFTWDSRPKPMSTATTATTVLFKNRKLNCLKTALFKQFKHVEHDFLI